MMESLRSPTTYVAAGNCPAVSQHKAWCNDVAGHVGPHWATRLLHDGSTKRESFLAAYFGRGE